MSMNEIMVVCFAKVLEQLKPDIVYADAADVKAERFAENLRKPGARENTCPWEQDLFHSL
jgi:ribonuclease HII